MYENEQCDNVFLSDRTLLTLRYYQCDFFVLASNDHTSTGWQFHPLTGLMLKIFNLLAFLFFFKVVSPMP